MEVQPEIVCEARVIFLRTHHSRTLFSEKNRPVRREEQIKQEPALALRDLGRILDLHGALN